MTEAPVATISDAALDLELAKLQSSEQKQCSHALAMLCALMPRLTSEQLRRLPVGRVLELVSDGQDAAVQANACAVLTAAAMQEDEEVHQHVVQQAVEPLAHLLVSCSPSSSAGADAPSTPESLHLNVLMALGTMAREGGLAAEALQQPASLEAVLHFCSMEQAARVQEAAANALCAVASQGPEAQDALLAAGAVPAAAGLLAVPQPEVRVLALMCLGMLLPQRQAAQQALADAPGALPLLLALLRQRDDEDIRAIARDLLALLSQDADIKSRIEGAMRESLAVS